MDDKIKLLCLPYSGASGSFYLSWQRFFPDHIRVCPIEYPGRGKLFNDALCTSVSALVDAICNQVTEEVNGCRYAIFGHSLGGLVAYELVKRLSVYHADMPLHIFISGATPPHEKYGDVILHTLPDYEFIREIMKLGGLSEEVVNHKELITLYTPIIRSDYKLYETYTCTDKTPLDVDMTVFISDADHLVQKTNPDDWRQYTTKGFQLKMFSGDHFFIHQHLSAVTAAIGAALDG